METRDIDLTKCNNCRYKAMIDGEEDYGYICVKKGCHAFLYSDKKEIYVAVWNSDERVINGTLDRNVTDFEIVPRAPETYRDWHVGDTVKNPDAVCYIGRVIFVSGDFVAIETDGHCVCYTREELFNDGYRLVLTDIENQLIEEKRKYEPQDGDVCYVKSTSGYYAIFVYNRDKSNEETDLYVSFDSSGNLFYFGYAVNHSDIEEFRPATDEEKKRLFDAMAKQGKRWNAEKKVVEDIPKPYEFKKGEPVLVRNFIGEPWELSAFLEKDGMSFTVRYPFGADAPFNYCIPYNERTMHLLGTSEDYREGE